MTRKARSDSRLKTLPADRQKQIALWSRECSLEALADKLKDELGVTTSRSALSEFLSWYHLSRHLEDAASFADQLKQTLKDLPNLKLDEEQINSAAQVVFELDAAREKDSKTFVALRRLRQKDKDQQLDSRRLALLEKKAAQADEAESTLKDSALSPEQRMERMRQIFGMS